MIKIWFVFSTKNTLLKTGMASKISTSVTRILSLTHVFDKCIIKINIFTIQTVSLNTKDLFVKINYIATVMLRNVYFFIKDATKCSRWHCCVEDVVCTAFFSAHVEIPLVYSSFVIIFAFRWTWCVVFMALLDVMVSLSVCIEVNHPATTGFIHWTAKFHVISFRQKLFLSIIRLTECTVTKHCISGVTSFITHDEQLKKNRCCYFTRASYASWCLLWNNKR